MSFPLFRFLRHVPVIYVDYPGPTSLTQIYGTFNRAMLRIVPPLRSYAQPLTDAMVEFYSMSQVQTKTVIKLLILFSSLPMLGTLLGLKTSSLIIKLKIIYQEMFIEPFKVS